MIKTVQERFEEFFAAQNDIPVETVIQYRWDKKEGYRLPGLATKYTYFKEAAKQMAVVSSQLLHQELINTLIRKDQHRMQSQRDQVFNICKTLIDEKNERLRADGKPVIVYQNSRLSIDSEGVQV